MLNGDDIQLDILDTAGQEEYLGIRENYFRTGEGFMCVFSITDPESFERIAEFKEEIERIKGEERNISFLLVGNKIDLKDERQVTEEQARAKAAEWNVPYIETSAKTRENVQKAFMDLCADVARRKVEAEKKGSGKKPKKPRGKIRCNIL